MAGPNDFMFNPMAGAFPQGVDPQSMYARGPAGGLPQGTDRQSFAKPANVEAEIYAGLINRGMSPELAAAWMLNFKDESGLNPGINEIAPLVAGSRGGYGLYQLTGPRRRAYEAYATERGLPFDSIDAQLDFMMTELQGPEARAWEKIQAAGNTGEAAAAIVNYFLRPAEEHRNRRASKYRGAEYVPPAGNALAVMGPAGGPEPQNALAPQPQFQWADMRQDPAMFMVANRRNALAM